MFCNMSDREFKRAVRKIAAIAEGPKGPVRDVAVMALGTIVLALEFAHKPTA